MKWLEQTERERKNLEVYECKGLKRTDSGSALHRRPLIPTGSHIYSHPDRMGMRGYCRASKKEIVL